LTGERVEKTALTPSKRIRLARAHCETYEAEADVVGLVKVLDTTKKNVNDRLGSISEIDKLECLAHYSLVSKIESLASLSDGWLEGAGIAPTIENIN
jgi:hypothetical protein